MTQISFALPPLTALLIKNSPLNHFLALAQPLLSISPRVRAERRLTLTTSDVFLPATASNFS
jgi:hypothetical protein